jgi:hypothetical protein
MTLQDWCRRNNAIPRPIDGYDGSTSVLSSTTWPEYHKLWYLDDFTVSSVVGPVVYLVPKKVPSEESCRG